MIVLLGGEKGGTGKSTLATNLAACLAQQGCDVILVDTDIQRTAANWVDRRNLQEDVRTVHCAERRGNVYEFLRDLAKRYEQVIVDAGGRDSEELRTALVAAHQVYVPLKASQPDLETSLHMNELINLARGMNQVLKARVLICMAPTNPSIHETAEAQELLAELSSFNASTVTIGERKAYRDAMVEGRGVIELSNEKAKAEIMALVQEIYGDEEDGEV
ncbi:MAG: division plane positioning ATPase MipZ [Candidatus Competibacteraceae bacterium]